MAKDRKENERVPATEAALVLSMNRERLIRRIQLGQIRGGKYLGHWFVDRDALEAALDANGQGSRQ